MAISSRIWPTNPTYVEKGINHLYKITENLNIIENCLTKENDRNLFMVPTYLFY